MILIPQALFLRLAAAVLTASLALPVAAQAPPPEFKELQAASGIQEPGARLKELERIKAAYPASAVIQVLDSQIMATRVVQAATLDAVLALQKDGLAGSVGMQRFSNFVMVSNQLLEHPKAASFDKGKVLTALQGYRNQAQKALVDPAALAGLNERSREVLPGMVRDLDLSVARAQFLAGDAAGALTSLDAYSQASGRTSGVYFLARGEVLEALTRPKDAYEALVGAALENNKEGLRRARAAYAKLNGKEDGFDAMLEARSRELPFHPAPIKPGPTWTGRAVLAELFTGSECPPCVAADFAFDGLLESFPATALVVLEYHLPIPAPDPMMNPATRRRQDYYGVNSTPSMFFDGQDKLTGGGGRSMAGTQYKQLAAKVAARLEVAPGVALKAEALRKGDRIEVRVALGKAAPEVEFHLALVQGQQEHKGGNRLLVHKMVVRDIQTLEAAAPKAAFSLLGLEKATDAYLSEFEQTSTRFKGFRFPVRRHLISREGLKVVLFAQDRVSKQVLQAVVADVK